jgi:hypothetical protein
MHGLHNDEQSLAISCRDGQASQAGVNNYRAVGLLRNWSTFYSHFRSDSTGGHC